jgi:hypothetical protein
MPSKRQDATTLVTHATNHLTMIHRRFVATTACTLERPAIHVVKLAAHWHVAYHAGSTLRSGGSSRSSIVWGTFPGKVGVEFPVGACSPAFCCWLSGLLLVTWLFELASALVAPDGLPEEACTGDVDDLGLLLCLLRGETRPFCKSC